MSKSSVICCRSNAQKTLRLWTYFAKQLCSILRTACKPGNLLESVTAYRNRPIVVSRHGGIVVDFRLLQSSCTAHFTDRCPTFSDSPIITFEPFSPYTVRLGRSANITCQVDANPPVNSVTWQKNGNPLPGKMPSHLTPSVVRIWLYIYAGKQNAKF